MTQLIEPLTNRTSHVPGAMFPRLTVARRTERPLAVDDIESCFRAHGGLANGDELAGALRGHLDQPVSCIARLIVSRQILVIERRQCTWVPLFQFADARLTVRPQVRQVMAELVDVFDDDELAAWFVTRNGWLGGLRPVMAIGAQPEDVHAAARADRFVATGN